MGKRGERKRLGTLQVAARGAAAGLAGGLAVAVFEREVLSRVAGGAPHRAKWDDLAARQLRRTGLPVRGKGTIAAGIGSQLLVAAALGATYAVLREQTRDSHAGRAMVDGAMTYAAGLVFPDIPEPKRRGPTKGLRKKLVRPANPAATYARFTGMALGLLVK